MSLDSFTLGGNRSDVSGELIRVALHTYGRVLSLIFVDRD